MKLFYIKHLYETKPQTGWINADSLSASGWALWHQLNIVSLVFRCKQSRAAVMNTTLICIIRRQDEKKIPSKLFFKTVSFPQRYIHINSYTKWLAFFYESHESKSSLESAVHESKSSPKSLGLFDFMRHRQESAPPDKSNAFWLEHLSDFDRRCSRLTITCAIKVPREQTRPAA